MSGPPLKLETLPQQLRECVDILLESVRATGVKAYIVGGFSIFLLTGKKVPEDIDVLTLDEHSRHRLARTLTRILGEPQTIRNKEVLRFKHGKYFVDLVESKGPTLEEDARCRDFTVNAFYITLPEFDAEDPLGGIKDLFSGICKTCDIPEKTFYEDPGRIVRMVRISTELDISPHHDVAAAALRMKGWLRTLRSERIGEEMRKILLSPRVHPVLLALKKARLVEYVLPELLPSVDFDQQTPYHFENVFSHAARVTGLVPPKLALRAAALFHDAGKPHAAVKKERRLSFPGHEHISAKLAARALLRWGFPRNTRKTVESLIRHHMLIYTPEWTDRAVRRFIKRTEGFREDLYCLVEADIISRSDLAKAESIQALSELKHRVEKLLEETSAGEMKSPLNGYEIMEILNIQPGPAVGFLKKRLEEMVVDGVLSPDNKEKAVQVLKEEYEKFRKGDFSCEQS